MLHFIDLNDTALSRLLFTVGNPKRYNVGLDYIGYRSSTLCELSVFGVGTLIRESRLTGRRIKCFRDRMRFDMPWKPILKV
jgi:hypothetical protein